MTTPAHRIHYSRADYLGLEASSNVKHEYLGGQIYGMAGGSPEHAALAAAVIGLLFPQLRTGRCRAYDADLRVRVMATGLSTYPDVSIVCGPRDHDPEDSNAVTNPTVLFEVLSRSTEDYDRGDKFDHYKHIPSLRHYVLVSQRERRIDVFAHGAGDDDWTCVTSVEGGVAEIASIGATLAVTELYEAAAQPMA